MLRSTQARTVAGKPRATVSVMCLGERQRSGYSIVNYRRRRPRSITASQTVMQPNPKTVRSAAAVATAATSFFSIGPGPAGRSQFGAARRLIVIGQVCFVVQAEGARVEIG